MTSQHDPSEDRIGHAWHVRRAGFAPDAPLFELYNDALTTADIMDAMDGALKDRPRALQFRFDPEGDEYLSLVVEGVQVIDSGPSMALRGESWHDHGSRLAITGWAQVYEDFKIGGVHCTGPCRVLTMFRPVNDAEPIMGSSPGDVGLSFTGQMTPQVPAAEIKCLAYIDDPSDLTR